MNKNKRQQSFPEREIRAYFTNDFIRVYQAYSDQNGDSAVEKQKFVSPPFKMTRMIWIKPSFFWMMYRAGWGFKDNRQKRILAIDITHDGFLWALSNSCMSSFKPTLMPSRDEWLKQKENSPVRIQWDPERNFQIEKLDHRSIQIGLSGDAVQRYTNEWIVKITDITELAHNIKKKSDLGDRRTVEELAPIEKTYPVPTEIKKRLCIE